MKVMYLQHSGVVVEYEDYVLIFDYYRGELPTFSRQKRICVFVSHWHQDHFQRQIFDWMQEYPQITYLLSEGIRVEKGGHIVMVKPNQEYHTEGFEILTLPSTDEGVAFFVRIPGKDGEWKSIYHAGDLNWWHWEEESEKYNQEMRRAYQEALRPLRGAHIDVAFVPVDPRLGEAYYLGIHYFLQHTDTAAALPIHLWEKYEICQKLFDQPEMADYREKLLMVSRAPQVFEI